MILIQFILTLLILFPAFYFFRRWCHGKGYYLAAESYKETVKRFCRNEYTEILRFQTEHIRVLQEKLGECDK